MTARRPPGDRGKGQLDGPAAKRTGRGQPVGRDKWPASGKTRAWLEFCDQVRRDNGMPSLRTLAERLYLSFNRVGELLRGEGLPVDDEQARDFLVALGATDLEAGRGTRLYKASRAEQEQAKRDAGQPDWWLRSGYADQVRDIAPPQLLGRQGEMDELCRWCASGDEAYVRWEAGPQAGKSALMAWLVLHPPPGTWVISFFVSASRNTQADSAAYTDGLLDQLAAITGDEVPASASPRQRDQMRRQILEQAASRALEAGRRLVLVVDGLDEDCGSLPGSGLASIAACLPVRPPPALRVIISARPDPPVPADVGLEHPLRGCRVRPLDASPYAAQVMHLAQQELDFVVATHKDGLGYQVLGLVTAGGGGLDDRDLQQLTGQDASSIDRLLNGTFGRTVAARADSRTKTRAFRFTHDTLREQAIARLGPYTLAGFTERLHSWADGYRHSGWPQDTPGYLLQGYARMLADAGDLDRFVALASDTARHRRMLDATGGDAAALAEISAAHALIGATETPDLLAALRLAWHRRQLANRNSFIPAQLPAAWAAAGQLVRAEALARSIPHPLERAQALTNVAEVVTGAREYGRAEQIARSIRPYEQARALADVARAVAHAGDCDRAEQIARSISNPEEQAVTLAAIAAHAGDYDRAEQIARSISRADERERALAILAVVTDARHYDRAEQIARSISNPTPQIQALASVARAVAHAGDCDRAEQIARSISNPEEQAVTLAVVAAYDGDYDRAEQFARSVRPYEQARALADVATAVAEAGDYDRAEQFARPISRTEHKERAQAAIAVALANAREYDRAEQIARSISNPTPQIRALASVARAVAHAGDYDRARRLAADTEQIARPNFRIYGTYELGLDLVAVVRALAGAGDYDRAEQIARSISSPYEHAEALAEVARAMAETGGYDSAEQIARPISDPDEQTRALAVVAAHAGDYDSAEQLARSIRSPDERARALGDVARAADPSAPARARSWIVEALGTGRSAIPLEALARIDPTSVSAFADELTASVTLSRPLDNGPLSST